MNIKVKRLSLTEANKIMYANKSTNQNHTIKGKCDKCKLITFKAKTATIKRLSDLRCDECGEPVERTSTASTYEWSVTP